MIHNVPAFVSILMVLCLALTLFCVFRASSNSKSFLIFILVVVLVQGGLAFADFYNHIQSHPFRFPFIVAPSLLLIVIGFIHPKSRNFLDGLDPGWLTFLHVVRFPVELVLYWLSVYQMVPEVMTFEGHNFDIISGLSAPFIAYWIYVKKSLDSKFAIVWNVACLALLANIVVTAILSVPGPLQQLGFETPNKGVLYFPFVWLPSIIVPLVLLSHIVCLRYHISRWKS